MRSIVLIALATLACSDTAPHKEMNATDLATELSRQDTIPDSTPAVCGDGLCVPGENCLFCPADCECSCGDGACTHGEWCAICPSDCDCDTLAATPPMGWNSWNLFACDIDEDLVQGIADALVESGMADLGYRYVNLDDCWQVDRDTSGVIIPDPDRFPAGIHALASDIHSKGLKLGLYTCAGTLTCEERPGSYGFEDIDLQTYADWEVDFVKVDWCFTEGMVASQRYQAFRDAIDKTGREIMLSICNWGFQDTPVWAPQIGELWRTSADIKDNVMGLLFNLLAVEPTAPFARVGHWNDPDMLEVGNGGMSLAQYQSHFGLWCLFAAPLIAGNDLRAMDEETRSVLMNVEAIAVDQDPSGLQGTLLHEDGPVRVYGRPLTLDGARAVVLFNADQEATATGKIKWAELGLAPGEAHVRDLWTHQDLGRFANGYQVELLPIHSRFLRIDGTEPLPPSGTSQISAWPWKYAANWEGDARRNTNAAGGSIRLAGTTYPKGIGTSGASRIVLHLAGRCTALKATVGIDDAAGPLGSVSFAVLADGEALYASGIMTTTDAPETLSIDLTGRREVHLVVTPGGDQTDDDLANWAAAALECL